MRLLFLDEEFPFPLNSGKRIRTFSLVSRLASTCEVDYLAFGAADSDAAAALRDAGVRPHAVPVRLPAKQGPGFYWRLLRNVFSSAPYSVTTHYHRRFAEAADALLDTGGFDAVICEWTPYAQYVRARAELPRIVCAHNIEHQIWERLATHEPHPLRRWYFGLQAVKWRRFEHDVFRWVDGVAAVSAGDRRTIVAVNPDLPVDVIDNGVDLDAFRSDEGPDGEASLVFVGALDWRANQDAVAHMVRDVMPRIRKRLPQTELTIVGRHPPAWISALDGHDGVVVAGMVPDVRPYVAEAAVYVVPLRVGGGSRLKILEALAMKRAVVSTSVGAEGLDVVDGEHLILADDPDAFAQAVVDLAGDPERRRRLGAAGRDLVERSYGWDSLAERLLRFVGQRVAAADARQP